MPGRNVRVGRIAGIPVGISPWWLLIVALLTWSLAREYFPQHSGTEGVAALALALAAVLTLFAGILAHEFAHAIVARRAGVQIEEIDLWLLGGVARMRGRPRCARDELRFALAGPALTIVLAVVFAVPALLLDVSPLQAFVAYQARVNAAIAAFNLLPALPLDGGRAARAWLWRRTGDFTRATVVAARAGRWAGYGLIYLGVVAVIAGLLTGLWFAMIGWFLVIAASGEQRQAELARTLDGIVARQVMAVPVVSVPAFVSPAQAGAVLAEHGLRSLPVLDAHGGVLGLLDRERAASERFPTAGAAALAVPALLIGPDEPVGALVDRPEFLSLGLAVVVDDDTRLPLGVIAVGDLERCAQPAQSPLRAIPTEKELTMPAKLKPGRVGDRLEVSMPGGGLPRRGVIAEVIGGPHHEHYVVEWNDGHRSIHYPAEGTRIVPAEAAQGPRPIRT